MNKCTVWSLLLSIGWATTLLAQGPAGAANAKEPDNGIAFTPGMARGLAGVYVNEMMRKRYSLADESAAQATELVARRIMQLAHAVDGDAQELLSRWFEEQMKRQAEGGSDNDFVPPAFGREFGERVLPLLPQIRELGRGVCQDVRPLLKPKQQLKLAGDMMAFKVGVDAFEETMKVWANGQGDRFDDPFRQQRLSKKDKEGRTETLKNAQDYATRVIERGRANSWSYYLEQFKKLYELDPAQISTAESILREYTSREKLVRKDPEQQAMRYRLNVWQHMIWQVPGAWLHPVKFLMDDERARIEADGDVMEKEYKTRLESVPTRSQRQAAQGRIATLLKNKGFEVTP